MSFLIIEVMTCVLLFRLNLHASPKVCFRRLVRLGSWAGGHVLVCCFFLFWPVVLGLPGLGPVVWFLLAFTCFNIL